MTGRVNGSHGLRLGLIGAARIWNIGCWIDLAALGVAAAVTYAISIAPLGGGDYGQWLMVSNYYLGQDVPDYRDLQGIPPVMPALLALTRVIVRDPIVSLEVFRIALVLALVTSFYIAGRVVFQRREAGLLSMLSGVFLTDRFLDLFAFGGLLQLGAIVFMLLGVAAYARAVSEQNLRWWILGSLAIGLAALSHAGTGVMTISAGLAVALVSALRSRGVARSERVKAMMPLAAVLALLAVYWSTTLLSPNSGYVSNPASLAYRGPGKLWDDLVSHRPTVVLLVAGGLLLLQGSLSEISSRRIGGNLLVASWAVSSWGVLALATILGVGTDYPRFAGPLLAPLAVAIGGLACVEEKLRASLGTRVPAVASLNITAVVAGIVLLGLGPTAMRAYQEEAAGYKVSDLHALRTIADRIDSLIPADQAVLSAEAREGKWIEGLTGRAVLFSNPVRYSFRPVEWERSVAAEALVRSTTALTNGFFFVKFVDQKASSGGDDTPSAPWVAANHGGEYVDLIRLLPSQTRVLTADSLHPVLATLQALEAASVERVETNDRVQVRTVWVGERQTGIVRYTRVLDLERDRRTFDLLDVVESDAPVQDIELEIVPAPGLSPVDVDIGAGQADLYFRRMGASRPHVRLTVMDGSGHIERTEQGILVRVTDNRLHLRFTALTAGEPVSQLALLYPHQLLEDYAIGAVLLKRDASLEARMERLQSLGLRFETMVPPYVLMVRDYIPVLSPATEVSDDRQP